MSQLPNQEDRAILAQVIMRLLDEWEIESAQRVTLLGFPEDTRPRSLARYRSGDALPEDNDVLLRAQYLLEIHHALSTTFPMVDAMAKYWVTTENQFFNDRTPMAVMLEDGLEGMSRIRNHIDANDSWG